MKRALVVALAAVLCACSPAPAPKSSPEALDNAQLNEQVLAVERAFADSMARRDHAAFAGFLDPETVFFSGSGVLRGKDAVAAAWSAYFEGEAPFSWAPDAVEVLDSGTLALSTGPVRDPSGKVMARFDSIWRRNESGEWKIVFDKGGPAEESP
jgi:ketosteroid isomerase-like protein